MTERHRIASAKLRKRAKRQLVEFLELWAEAQQLDPDATKISGEKLMGQLAEAWAPTKRLIAAKDDAIAELNSRAMDPADLAALTEIKAVAAQAPPAPIAQPAPAIPPAPVAL